MTLKLLKTQEKRREVKENRKMDLNWIRKSFGQCFWFYLLMHCVYIFCHCTYALFVPSFFSFLLSLTLCIYLSIEYNYDDAHAISLLYYYVIENDWQCFPVKSTENYCLSNGWKSNWSKMLMSLWVFFIPFHFFMFSVSLSLYNLNA